MTALDAAIFLPFTLAIGIFVAWSDMKSMKITNQSVLALLAVWVVLGPILLPLSVWGWGLALAGGALLLGFFASTLGLFGAGDAKFITAMAPFFVQGDVRGILVLSAAVMLAALAVHRVVRAIPALRGAALDWESWSRRDFPMGLALAGILNIYLALKAMALFMA